MFENNPLNLTLPEKPQPTEEESKMAESFASLMNDANYIVPTYDTPGIAQDIPLGEDIIWLVGAPMDIVPQDALLIGTYFYSEADNDLLAYLLSGSGKKVVRTDARAIGKIMEAGDKNQLEIMKNGKYIFSSLPPGDSVAYFNQFGRYGFTHENSNGKDNRVLADLFFQEQILKRIQAKVPDTAWVTVADYFKHGENEESLRALISEKLEKAGINPFDKVFIRLGKGSMKNIDGRTAGENMFVRALANIPAFLISASMGKLRRLTTMFLKDGKVEESPETVAYSETTRVELSAIQKVMNGSPEISTTMNKIVNGILKDASLTAKERSIKDWIIPASPEEISKKISDSFILGISSNLITESGYALRKYIDVQKASDGLGYAVPFSKDYRGIVYDGKLVAVTTWTPYRDVMNPNKTLKIKLSDYAISNEALKEVQQVAEEFSKVTGFSSFTLDFLIPSDGMPVFHEMNRLEFSSMSHPAVRMLVAYLRYQKSIGKEGNEMAFRDFVGSVKEDKEKFTRLFYGRMLKFFERISLDNPKFKELLQIHQKTISEEYDMFRLYAPIWAIWNTRCGISSKNGENGYNVSEQ